VFNRNFAQPRLGVALGKKLGRKLDDRLDETVNRSMKRRLNSAPSLMLCSSDGFIEIYSHVYGRIRILAYKPV
jgi:hypothetical protein